MELKKGFYHCPEVDTLHTVRDMLHYAKKKFSTNIAYQQIEHKGYETAITFRGFADNVDALGTALIAHGLKGRHIALLGETSIEWITAYFAALNGVGVVVPMDSELNAETLVRQLNTGDVDAIFCSKRLSRKLAPALRECPNIKTVISMRTDLALDCPEGVTQLAIQPLIDEGSQLLREGNTDYTKAEIDPDALV